MHPAECTEMVAIRQAERALGNFSITRRHETQTLLVLPYVSRFLAYLHLQDRIAGGVEAVEGRGPGVELIAEDEDQMAQSHRRFRALGLCAARSCVLSVSTRYSRSPGLSLEAILSFFLYGSRASCAGAARDWREA